MYIPPPLAFLDLRYCKRSFPLLLDSSISAKALKQIAAGDEDMELGKADTKIATKVIDDCEDS